ncbi:hypothetical protein IPM09_02010 [Candidatus Saccharibacteria bacterium]|nr:MAG: hypothetical protein IPM09_02010 [Candidatus Saccharibacteria bacterium]
MKWSAVLSVFEKMPSYMATWLLIVMSQAGLVLSIVLTKDTRWFTWHLSRLGEGGQVASAIFNFTMGMSAVILVIIATRLVSDMRQTRWHHGGITLRNVLIGIAFCWIGVACFPFDRYAVIHNVFGYGQFLLVSVVMLRLRHICPRFSSRTYIIGVASVVGVSLLLASFHLLHIGSVLMAELLGQFTLFSWLLSLTHDVNPRKHA